MEARLNFNIPLSIYELAELIREQLPTQERKALAKLISLDDSEMSDNDVDPTQEQLVEEMKQAVSEVNLIKQGKAKGRPLQELLDEL